MGFGEFQGDAQLINQHYQKARTLYKDAKFKDAYAEFFKAYELENHKLFSLYMERCAQNQDKDLQDISDVHRLTTK